MEMIGNPTPAGETTDKWTYDTVIGSHSFTFRLLTGAVGPGNYISSDTLTVGGHDWALFLYPDGKHEYPSYVSVFIARTSQGGNVRALFEITLLDQSGRDRHKVCGHFNRQPGKGPYTTLINKGSMWGYNMFLKRTVLETSNYIKDGCISFNFTVGVVRSRFEAQLKEDRVAMAHDLKVLLESGMGSDVCINVGGVKFKAHKSILAAHSPVFRAQFFEQIGYPNVSMIEISDIEPSMFKVMLQFIYSGSYPDLHEIPGSTSTNMIQGLLKAADRYGLDRLKQFCEARLFEDANAQIVAALSPVEHQYTQPLEAICFKFAAAGILQQRLPS